MAVMAQPSAALSGATSAFVSMRWAVNSASFKINDNAIEKQPPCAAPITPVA
jgi:hypothetical protein